MKITIAPDAFKGSLSALEVCQAMTRGIKKIFPNAEIETIPLADGGEGTIHALVAATKGKLKKNKVIGPLGQSLRAVYGILGDGKTAIIEMASASGLALLSPEKRTPLKTTTYGTGQLIVRAIEKGYRKIIIGIGGSATTDCGTGMAQALGVKFIDKNGRDITAFMNGERMGRVSDIDISMTHPEVSKCDIRVACDVKNPLLGREGAARVYSPQKGATPAQVEYLERNMGHIIQIIEKKINRKIRDIPGAGAAGGLGAGLMAFAHAKCESGIKLVLEACQFAKHIRGSQLILTGEGQVDGQTAFGKTIMGVIKEAHKQAIPVIVIAGSVGEGAEKLLAKGVTSLFSICTGPLSLEEAMGKANTLVESCTERVLRVISMNTSSEIE